MKGGSCKKSKHGDLIIKTGWRRPSEIRLGLKDFNKEWKVTPPLHNCMS